LEPTIGPNERFQIIVSAHRPNRLRNKEEEEAFGCCWVEDEEADEPIILRLGTG
jgi:hypothetical protein